MDRQQVVPHHLKRSTNDPTQDIAVLERLAPFWQLYKVNQQVIVQNLQVHGGMSDPSKYTAGNSDQREAPHQAALCAICIPVSCAG